MSSFNVFEEQDSSYIGDFRGATLLDDTTDLFLLDEQQPSNTAPTTSSGDDSNAETERPSSSRRRSVRSRDSTEFTEQTQKNQDADELNSGASRRRTFGDLGLPPMPNMYNMLPGESYAVLGAVPGGNEFGNFNQTMPNNVAQYAPIDNMQFAPGYPPQYGVNFYGNAPFGNVPPQGRRQSSSEPLTIRDIYGNYQTISRRQIQQFSPVQPRPPPSRLSLRDSNFSNPGFDAYRASQQSPIHRQQANPSLSRNRTVQTSNFKPEQPQRDVERPWVRTNGRNKTTGSTRTGKIVQFRPEEIYRAPNVPINAPWVGPASNKVFEYNSFGELKELKYTAAELEDYMINYSPPSNSSRLKVWIQKAPADSARRQPTSGSSKCRMAECPASIYDSTITVGNFRLAFDEQWHTHGVEKDPHVCAGFIHLYCAERFMDFKRLVQLADVEPDERMFATEPNGRFAASLAQMASADDAREFITYAQAAADPEEAHLFEMHWPQYPAQPHYASGFEVHHTRTLGYKMFKTKIARMNKSKLQMLQGRGVKKSNQLAHFGDVEKAVKSRHGATERRRRMIADFNEDSDEISPAPLPRKRRRAASESESESTLRDRLDARERRRAGREQELRSLQTTGLNAMPSTSGSVKDSASASSAHALNSLNQPFSTALPGMFQGSRGRAYVNAAKDDFLKNYEAPLSATTPTLGTRGAARDLRKRNSRVTYAEVQPEGEEANENEDDDASDGGSLFNDEED